MAGDNTSFMQMWNIYDHCRRSHDTREIQIDVGLLKQASRALGVPKTAPTLLPAAIERRLSPLPSRLAVDPSEMTMSCAVHGTEVARAAGQSDMERELLMAVMETAKPAPVHSTSSIEIRQGASAPAYTH